MGHVTVVDPSDDVETELADLTSVSLQSLLSDGVLPDVLADVVRRLVVPADDGPLDISAFGSSI